ncbi:MAG: type II secretion system protein [Ruminococcus sp.]|nr:type II secretion system protein [Ruminococcus sp.]
MSKKASYFKSKKGFSLIELLCAVVIMAIVVSATATGLAVSYKSIMIGSTQDKASAKAQEYCDIIMTYVQNTPSHDPTSTSYIAGTESDPSKNLLFDLTKGSKCKFTTDVMEQVIAATGTLPDPTKDTAIEQLNDKAAVEARVKNDDKPYFIVEKNGTFEHNGIKFVSYQITTYVDYGNGKYTTYCTGSVTRPKYQP